MAKLNAAFSVTHARGRRFDHKFSNPKVRKPRWKSNRKRKYPVPKR